MNPRPTASFRFQMSMVAACCVLLSGCGAEVAGTATAIAATQAAQASQAKAQQDKIVDSFKKAQEATARAASAAD